MPESSAWADVAKNRVYIKFDGYMELEEAEKLRDDVKKALRQIKSGFTILTDARGYKPGTKEVQAVISSIAKMDADAGVSKVARVTGDKPLGGMQIDRLAKETTENKYPARHFATIEEGEAYLDSDLDT